MNLSLHTMITLFLKLVLKLLYFFFIILAFQLCKTTERKIATLHPEQYNYKSTFPSVKIYHSIETGQHILPLSSYSISKDGKWIATVSTDKSIKVLELLTGKLVKIIYPFPGEGEEGALYSVAFCPNSDCILFSGWTGPTFHGNFSIYIYDLTKGILTKEISGFPFPVKHISLTPDGKYLLASLTQGGIHIYNFANSTLVKEDSNYEGNIENLYYPKFGYILSITNKCELKIYNEELKIKLDYKVETSDCSTIKFDPNQDSIYYYSSKESQLKSLSFVDSIFNKYKPVIKELISFNNPNIQDVGKFTDNSILYMANNNESSMLELFSYTAEKEQKLDTFPLGTTKEKFVHLPENKIAIFTADSHYRIYSENGLLFLKRKLTPVFKTGMDRILTSPNGEMVSFPFFIGKSSVAFSVEQKKIVFNPPELNDIYPPNLLSSNFFLRNWKNSNAPLFFDREIPLLPGEFSCCISIDKEDQFFILGTNEHLIKFDKAGNEVWRTKLKQNLLDLVLTADSKWIVTAMEDGSIQWYRAKDGIELFSLIALYKKNSWVLFTPEGFYDTSLSINKVTGFKVFMKKYNRTIYIPSHSFRKTLYKKDLFKQILKSGKSIYELYPNLKKEREKLENRILKLAKKKMKS